MPVDTKADVEGTFAVEFSAESFGVFLRAAFPSFPAHTPLRTDGTRCMECGLFVTWREGTCANGHDL
jgi:hypothetical protein